MAISYSLDLRRKVVQAWQRSGQSQRAIADFFGVSLSFVESMLRRVRRSGDLTPRTKIRSSGVPAVGALAA